MKALVLNAIGRGFDFEDVDIATPIGREVLLDVQASGLCHTDLLFATHDFVPTPSVLGREVAGVVAAIGPNVAQIRIGDHTDVIDSTKTKPVEAVRDLLPDGADHVFDFVGLKLVAEQGCLAQAVDSTWSE